MARHRRAAPAGDDIDGGHPRSAPRSGRSCVGDRSAASPAQRRTSSIGLLIMVSGMYGVLVEGRSWYSWVEQHAPIPSDALKRFSDAFVETGSRARVRHRRRGHAAVDRRDDRVPDPRRSIGARARNADADLLGDPRDRHGDRVGAGRGRARAHRSRRARRSRSPSIGVGRDRQHRQPRAAVADAAWSAPAADRT